MVTFFFSVHTITQEKQWAWRSQGGGSSSHADHLTWRALT